MREFQFHILPTLGIFSLFNLNHSGELVSAISLWFKFPLPWCWASSPRSIGHLGIPFVDWKKGNARESSNYHTIALISHARKVKLKILQARLQQFVNCELPDVQAGFRKGRGNRSNCQHLLDHLKSKRVPEKHLLLLYWLCQSFWLCGSQQTVKNSERDGNMRPLDLPSEESVCRLRSHS